MLNGWHKTQRNQMSVHSGITRRQEPSPQENYCPGKNLNENTIRNKILRERSTSQKSKKKGSTPKLEYLGFHDAKLAEKTNISKDSQVVQKKAQSAQRRNQEKLRIGQRIKLKVKGSENLPFRENVQQNSNRKFAGHIYFSQHSNKSENDTEYASQPIQITFSMDSTEPEQPSNQTQRRKRARNKPSVQQVLKNVRMNNPALQNWQRKRIQREVKSKQMEYRSLIRSLSKESGIQKKIISTKMKQVLDQLYSLKKATRNH